VHRLLIFLLVRPGHRWTYRVKSSVALLAGNVAEKRYKNVHCDWPFLTVWWTSSNPDPSSQIFLQTSPLCAFPDFVTVNIYWKQSTNNSAAGYVLPPFKNPGTKGWIASCLIIIGSAIITNYGWPHYCPSVINKAQSCEPSVTSCNEIKALWKSDGKCYGRIQMHRHLPSAAVSQKSLAERYVVYHSQSNANAMDQDICHAIEFSSLVGHLGHASVVVVTFVCLL